MLTEHEREKIVRKMNQEIQGYKNGKEEAVSIDCR